MHTGTVLVCIQSLAADDPHDQRYQSMSKLHKVTVWAAKNPTELRMVRA